MEPFRQKVILWLREAPLFLREYVEKGWNVVQSFPPIYNLDLSVRGAGSQSQFACFGQSDFQWKIV